MQSDVLRTGLIVLFLTAASIMGVTAEPEEGAPVEVDKPTEELIKGALTYLAHQQLSDGSWPTGSPGQQHPVSMTGYALMAFLASGNFPDEGEHAETVARGVQYLLDAIQPDGIFRGVDGGKYMYSHGIATIALSQVYGQTRSKAIREKLEKLIQVILHSQNDKGGWRYQPKPKDADLSVTVLQAASLRAAKNLGLEVPQATIDDAVAYVRTCSEPGSGGFTYQPAAKTAGFARTAAGVYSLQVCGKYDDPLVERASQYLFDNRSSTEWNTYGQNYAAPAQYLIGGDVWRRWYKLMRETMTEKAIKGGDSVHWETAEKYAGPVYVTSVYTIILAMPWNYVPLYQR